MANGCTKVLLGALQIARNGYCYSCFADKKQRLTWVQRFAPIRRSRESIKIQSRTQAALSPKPHFSRHLRAPVKGVVGLVRTSGVRKINKQLPATPIRCATLIELNLSLATRILFPLKKIFFNDCFFLTERERQRQSISGGGAEREGDTGSKTGSRL